MLNKRNSARFYNSKDIVKSDSQLDIATNSDRQLDKNRSNERIGDDSKLVDVHDKKDALSM